MKALKHQKNMQNIEIGVIILTKNEDLHLNRCLESIFKISKNIFVVDSFSNDKTLEILERHGIIYEKRAWLNYADQFQWAIDNFPYQVEWLMRLDADEYLSKELVQSILDLNPSQIEDYNSIYVNRRLVFNGKWIKYGGYYPVQLLRIWRSGTGSIEDRWMDEHIVVENENSMDVKGDIVDENLNNFSWWIQKHNGYASREALDYLIHELNIYEERVVLNRGDRSTELKRRLKDGLYEKLPLFIRAVFYYFYRYIIRFGFIDGSEGFIWHFMQGLWYRMLVDVKIWKVRNMVKNGETFQGAVSKELQIKLP